MLTGWGNYERTVVSFTKIRPQTNPTEFASVFYACIYLNRANGIIPRTSPKSISRSYFDPSSMCKLGFKTDFFITVSHPLKFESEYY